MSSHDSDLLRFWKASYADCARAKAAWIYTIYRYVKANEFNFAGSLMYGIGIKVFETL